MCITSIILYIFPVLQEAPTEVEAFQSKVVCLINLEKFNDALTAINKDKSAQR